MLPEHAFTELVPHRDSSCWKWPWLLQVSKTFKGSGSVSKIVPLVHVPLENVHPFLYSHFEQSETLVQYSGS